MNQTNLEAVYSPDISLYRANLLHPLFDVIRIQVYNFSRDELDIYGEPGLSEKVIREQLVSVLCSEIQKDLP